VCGGVRIGDGAFVGAGAVVVPGVTIGADAIVGAGAVVTRDVVPGTTVVGNPARETRG
jgi:acetyltransferase-like isoleucine patch superfamily enzyme